MDNKISFGCRFETDLTGALGKSVSELGRKFVKRKDIAPCQHTLSLKYDEFSKPGEDEHNLIHFFVDDYYTYSIHIDDLKKLVLNKNKDIRRIVDKWVKIFKMGIIAKKNSDRINILENSTESTKRSLYINKIRQNSALERGKTQHAKIWSSVVSSNEKRITNLEKRVKKIREMANAKLRKMANQDKDLQQITTI